MRRSFFLFFIFLVCIACTNDKKENFLTSPPYEQLTDSINRWPEEAELYYKRGILLYQNKQVAIAKADIQKAWGISPKEEYALSLARIFNQQAPDSAIIFLESAMKKLPGSIALQLSLAKTYHQKKNYAKALGICNQIISRYPAQLDALILQAELLEENGRDEEALISLEKAYSYAPDDVELVHNLAFKYADTKNKKTLALSDSLIQADINNIHAEPHLFKGIYYYRIQNFTQALIHFNEAITNDYKYLDAHLYKGQLLFDQKKYTEAIKAFQLALAITPTFAEAYYWIGKCKEEQNNPSEAKLDYLRAYSLDKTLVEAKVAADRL